MATAYERGGSTFKNGELLAAAETHGFQVLVTTDTNLEYQQNLASKTIANVALSTPSWPRIRVAAEPVIAAVAAATPGSFAEVMLPHA